jgi:acyl carrier protein
MFKSLITIALVAGASAFAPVSFAPRSSSSLSNDKVKELIVEQLGVDADKVVMSATFIDDLGADSLDTVELIMAIEEEFDCEIPEEEAAGISTVQEVCDFVNKL